MRIIAIKSGEKNTSSTYSIYIQQLLEEIFSENLYKIIYADDISFIKRNTGTEENSLLIITLPENISLRMRWWFKIKLPAFAKKINADAVIYLDDFLSQSLKIPQLLVLPGIGYLQHTKKNHQKWPSYSRKKIKKNLSRPQSVITYSATAKEFLITKYAAEEKKINIIYLSANPLFRATKDAEEKNITKEKYAAGKEYFLLLHDGLWNDILPALKAFSFFKKWQKSNMQLLIIAAPAADEISFTKKLDDYKYKNDVQIIKDISSEIYQQIMPAAYAVIIFAEPDKNIKNIIDAMQSEVPVITPNTQSIKEICGEAALYIENTTPEIFGKQLIEIFKNEPLRTRLIENGIAHLKKYDYSEAKQQLWQLFSKLS